MKILILFLNFYENTFLMRFWQIIFLKGQMTSDRAENFFFSLLNRYFSTTLLYQILFLMILFFKHIFLSILAEFGRFKHIFLSILATFWLILLMRFWQIIFLKGQMTSDRAEIFFFITKQILFHNFALPDFISNDFIFQAYFLKHFG